MIGKIIGRVKLRCIEGDAKKKNNSQKIKINKEGDNKPKTAR